MTTNTAKPANTATTANTAKTDDETPAAVKAVFTDAQSFTTQHKDVPADKIASIEKDTGGKVPDKDHHSYLAFATKDGKRTQIGAATIVKVGGKELVVIYDNKDGSPIIKEVRGDGLSSEFLKQFAGKGHDDKFTFDSIQSERSGRSNGKSDYFSHCGRCLDDAGTLRLGAFTLNENFRFQISDFKFGG